MFFFSFAQLLYAKDETKYILVFKNFTVVCVNLFKIYACLQEFLNSIFIKKINVQYYNAIKGKEKSVKLIQNRKIINLNYCTHLEKKIENNAT